MSCTDLPAIILLPAKMVTELRVIADYLVKAPGDNHTGKVILPPAYPACIICACRHCELVCSDSLQSVGEGHEPTPSNQPLYVTIKCKFMNLSYGPVLAHLYMIV